MPKLRVLILLLRVNNPSKPPRIYVLRLNILFWKYSCEILWRNWYDLGFCMWVFDIWGWLVIDPFEHLNFIIYVCFCYNFIFLVGNCVFWVTVDLICSRTCLFSVWFLLVGIAKRLNLCSWYFWGDVATHVFKK